MANWRAAKSITKFREQINAMFPGRDKISDGIVGDLAHSQRKSSHNPDAHGVVRAMDVTHNPAKGIDGNLLLNALLASKDARIWYIIFNAKIYNRKNNFKAEPYDGLNAHKHHLHLSVSDDPTLYDDDRAWDLTAPVNIPNSPTTNPQSNEQVNPAPSEYVVKKGDNLSVLAADNDTTIKELMRLNNLHSTVIYIGQKLRLK